MRARVLWSGLLAATLVVLGAVPASAKVLPPPHSVTEYLVPANRPSLNRITLGPDGNLWFTEGAGRIGQMTPDGAFKQFRTPSFKAGKNSNPLDITTGPDGNLWYTDFYGRIGRVTTSGEITEFQIGSPSNQVFFFGITAGPDQAMWFVINCCGPTNGMIGRISLSGDSVQMFPVKQGTAPAVGIISYQNQLWYTATNLPGPVDRNLGFIQRMSTMGVVTGNFQIPTAYPDPSRLTLGRDGDLYFTEQGAVGANGHQQPTHPALGKIGRINPSGQIHEFVVPDQDVANDFIANPAGIATGPDGDIWFTEYSYQSNVNGQQSGGNMIGRLDPFTGHIT
ncbi:MAG: hypothetical protein M3256_03270, partial [Actinomycetota bacterium]|nr:hypothetical protein [Actinomycetota bacterium]